MAEYIPLGIEKGYFSKENILDVLKQLTNGISKFELKPETDNKLIFGAWQGYVGEGTFKIKKNLDSASLRHVTMHELTHCVTVPYIVGNEYYSRQIIPRVEDNQSKSEEEKNKIHIRSKNDTVFKAETIIAELIAEATACDLCDSYQNRTYVGDRRMGITSDWVVTWNRTYQQLGDEFLQTLHFINNGDNTTDRMRFKALTIMALDPNNQILPMIIREYREKDSNGIEDLHFISENLKKINKKTYVPQEVFDRFRSAIQKYMPETWRPDEYLGEIVETPSIRIKPQSNTEESRQTIKIKSSTPSKHIKITPSSISDASRQISQYNPGKLSCLIDKVKSIFSRIADKFKDR